MHCVASQPFRRSATIPEKRDKGPKIAAFRAVDFVSRLPILQFWGVNCRKSPGTSAIIPVLRRPRSETWFDLHSVGDRAVLATVFSGHLLVKSGVSEQVLHDGGGRHLQAGLSK
jgi:hypothetical protein